MEIDRIIAEKSVDLFGMTINQVHGELIDEELTYSDFLTLLKEVAYEYGRVIERRYGDE